MKIVYIRQHMLCMCLQNLKQLLEQIALEQQEANFWHRITVKLHEKVQWEKMAYFCLLLIVKGCTAGQRLLS